MWQLSLLFIISIMWTIASAVYPHKSEKLKAQERNANQLQLYAVRMMHYFTFALSLLFPWIFPPSYDGWFLAYTVILWIHWELLKMECILSLWEKQILDPTYQLGDTPYSNPFIDLFGRDIGRFLVYITFFNLGFVLLRYFLAHK